jgi:hypothetical protein
MPEVGGTLEVHLFDDYFNGVLTLYTPEPGNDKTELRQAAVFARDRILERSLQQRYSIHIHMPEKKFPEIQYPDRETDELVLKLPGHADPILRFQMTSSGYLVATLLSNAESFIAENCGKLALPDSFLVRGDSSFSIGDLKIVPHGVTSRLSLPVTESGELEISALIRRDFIVELVFTGVPEEVILKSNAFGLFQLNSEMFPENSEMHATLTGVDLVIRRQPSGWEAENLGSRVVFISGVENGILDMGEKSSIDSYVSWFSIVDRKNRETLTFRIV